MNVELVKMAEKILGPINNTGIDEAIAPTAVATISKINEMNGFFALIRANDWSIPIFILSTFTKPSRPADASYW